METELMAFLGAILIFILVVSIIYYVVFAVALMKIAQRTNTENPWLAWIPIANLFLMVFVAKKEWWWALIILVSFIIPIIGPLIGMGLFIYIWWLICERLGKPGPLSLLMLVPIANIVLPLYLAFSK